MANYYVTTTGAGTNSGADWANAFDWAAFDSHSLASSVSNDIYWFAGGTYNITAAYSNLRDGLNGKPISFIGVNSSTTNEPPTFNDYAIGLNRPLFDLNANYIFVDNYWFFRNLRITSSNSSYTINADAGNTFVNCLIENTHGSSAYCIHIDDSTFYNCEIISHGGTRILRLNAYSIVKNCYLHGPSTQGIEATGRRNSFMENIIAGPGTGIDLPSGGGHSLVTNNTIYDCDTCGIDVTEAGNNIIINNIISNCGIGIKGAVAYLQAVLDYNNYYNNTLDVENVTKGLNALSFDPGFTDAANGDFSLTDASQLIGAGIGITLGVG